MRAHINVHEPKQEQDEDGLMTYSMEGVPPTTDATIFNSPWAPGWNSNQALFKFQKHTGAELSQAGHGELLFDGSAGAKAWYAATVSKATLQGFAMFPLYHLFGSEELTAKSDAIQARATAAYVALNPADAARLGLGASDGVQVQNNGAVPYLVRNSVQPGTVGISVGLSGLNFQDMTTGVALNKATNWQNPKDWRAGNIIVSDAGSASAYGRGTQGNG
jgi:NADH-quinone oxidoreductase subunit G